jgi:hypothetical protein
MPVPSASRVNEPGAVGVPPPISRRFIALLRGWDRYERAHGGPSIVDFDLAPPSPPTRFDNRGSILDALIEVRDNLNGNSGYAPFLRSRLGGSVAYLRALMGQSIPFGKYIEETLGVTAEFVPEAEVTAARTEVERSLAPYNLRYRREERVCFEREFLLYDESAIVRGIFDDKDLWLDRLRSLSVPVPSDVKVAVRSAVVDAPWANWIAGTSAGGFELSINLHPRKKYQRGSPLALCLHEICGHAAQMAIWSRRIEEGSLDGACGITTVHSPETFLAEGIGQTVHLLFARKFSLPPELWLRKAQQYHELLVMQNAHLMLYEGKEVEHVSRYVDELLPFAHREDVEIDLRNRALDPLSRTYQLSYSTAERTIRRLIDRMSDSQVCKFFSLLYQIPMTPAQVVGVGNEMSSAQ